MDWFLYDNGLRHERVKAFFFRYNKNTLNTIFLNLSEKILGLNLFFLLRLGMEGLTDLVPNYFSKAIGRVIQYLISGQIFLKQQLFKGKKTGKKMFFMVQIWIYLDVNFAQKLSWKNLSE